MIKQLLAGVAAVGLMSGIAFAQTYPPAPGPPPGTIVTPAVPVAPVPVPRTSTTTTTFAPTSDSHHREVNVHKDVDRKGNTVIEKDINLRASRAAPRRTRRPRLTGTARLLTRRPRRSTTRAATFLRISNTREDGMIKRLWATVAAASLVCRARFWRRPTFPLRRPRPLSLPVGWRAGVHDDDHDRFADHRPHHDYHKRGRRERQRDHEKGHLSRGRGRQLREAYDNVN